MSRDYLLFLEDMQTSCEKILRYTEDIDFEMFAADERTYDAVIFACKTSLQKKESISSTSF
jgi:uncharacterized protein with HEPN domain